MNKVNVVVLSLFLVLNIICKGETMYAKHVSFKSLEEIPESNLQRLSTYKIYFGHQSVGYNIIDGINDILHEHDNIRFNIVETSSAEDFKAPIFAHSRVGQNTRPISKIDGFSDFIEDGIGDKADIAFFKFCYVDINAETDINKIFNSYKAKMSYLKESYPQTTFVQVTVPLMSRQTGVKAVAKKLLGRPLRGYDDNIKRCRFNDLLREEFGKEKLLFDLALIEATFPDGTVNVQQKDGQAFHSLVPEYTSDGGHLNEKGRRVVAEQLLIFLINLTEGK
jgi:hypothetical protein